MKKISLLISVFLAVSVTMYSQSHEDTTVVELITFESESAYFVQGTPTTNSWQIGQPSKTLFNAAYSGTYAIVTDTMNPYPANNHSWFDLRINLNEYYWFINLGIGFYHKIQTESNKAGGYITVSYDKGATWNNIVNDSVCPFIFSPTYPCFSNVNLYSSNDFLFNGESGFSGTISEWQYVEFYWYIRMVTKFPNEVDTLLIRFNFISDSSASELDGWMIDDIRLFYNHFNGGISGNEAQKNLQAFPNPANENTVIRTMNRQKIMKAEIYAVNGKLVKEEAVQNTEFQFNKGNFEPGIYFIRCTFDHLKAETIKVIVED